MKNAQFAVMIGKASVQKNYDQFCKDQTTWIDYAIEECGYVAPLVVLHQKNGEQVSIMPKSECSKEDLYSFIRSLSNKYRNKLKFCAFITETYTKLLDKDDSIDDHQSIPISYESVGIFTRTKTQRNYTDFRKTKKGMKVNSQGAIIDNVSLDKQEGKLDILEGTIPGLFDGFF